MYKLHPGFKKNYFHAFRIEEQIWKLRNINYLKKTDLKENLRIPKKKYEWLVSPYEKYIFPIKGIIDINVWCNKTDEKKELTILPNKFIYKNESFVYENTPILVFNPNVHHQIISHKGSSLLTLYNCKKDLDLGKNYEFDKIEKLNDSLTRWMIKNGGS